MVLVTDLINKQTYLIPSKGDDHTVLRQCSSLQCRDRPYRYDFPKGSTYMQIESDDTITEPVKDRIFWKIVMHNYPKKSQQDTVKSIIDRVNRVYYQMKKTSISSQERAKMETFLSQLAKKQQAQEIIAARDQFIQTIPKAKGLSGGGLIWGLERTVENVFPQWVSWLFSGVLETIDMVLIILTAIPGLKAVGVGYVFDIAHLIYTLLRLDPTGVVGSIVSFIPVVGTAAGTAIKVSGKLAKWITQHAEPQVYDYPMHASNIVKLGRFYGPDVVSTIRFLSDFGSEAKSMLQNVVRNSKDGVDQDQLLVLYGPDAVRAINFADDDREGLLTAMKYADMFSDRATYAAQLGTEY